MVCIRHNIKGSFYDSYLIFNANRKKYKDAMFFTNEGYVIYSFDKNDKKDTVKILYIEVKKKYRRKGFFYNFLLELYLNRNVKQIEILSVNSDDMTNCLKKIDFKGDKFKINDDDYIFTKTN